MRKDARWQSFEELTTTEKHRILLAELREDYSQLEATLGRMSGANWRLREAAMRALAYILGDMVLSPDRTDALTELRHALGYEGGTDEQL